MMPSSLEAYLSNSRSDRQLFVLDGLRAIAIILVMFRHGFKVIDFETLQAQSSSFVVDLYAFLFHIGWTGVDLFFVLSGFLIGSQLLKFYDTGHTLGESWRFYANRFIRIAPPYFILLLLMQWCLVYMPIFADTLDAVVIGKAMPYHYLFLQDYFAPSMFPVFWSLAVEEKFYILAPLVIAGLFYLTKSHAWRIGWVCAFLALPLLARWQLFESNPDLSVVLYQSFRYSWFHLRADCLIAGILCAYLFYHLRQHPGLNLLKHGPWLFAAGALSSVVLLVTLPYEAPFGFYALVVSGLLLAVAFGALVLGGALIPNMWAGFLGSAPLFFMARISYSLYLTHDLWVLSSKQLFDGLTAELSLPLELELTAYFLLFSGIAVLMGSIFYYLFEKPFILLKNRFSIARISQVKAEENLPGSEETKVEPLPARQERGKTFR